MISIPYMWNVKEKTNKQNMTKLTDTENYSFEVPEETVSIVLLMCLSM